MGAVFKGVDVMVEREVAIKVLRPEIARQPEIVERFRSEAVTLARLIIRASPRCSVFPPGRRVLHGHGVRARPHARGGCSATSVHAGGTGGAGVREILAGIEHAHQLGILHRDIKPANVMLTTAGVVKVTDFASRASSARRA